MFNYDDDDDVHGMLCYGSVPNSHDEIIYCRIEKLIDMPHVRTIYIRKQQNVLTLYTK